MTTRTERHLRRVADAANITPAELRDLIESVVDEYLGLQPRDSQPTVRKTRARLVYGDSHAAMSFVSDAEGTDIVPAGYEPPAGYSGP